MSLLVHRFQISTLRKKLKQEIDTHKALERAFRRTLGVLPRFSPNLNPKVQELLAEVAVLEEEVINLEESIVALRQGLYNEAVLISNSKQQKEVKIDAEPIFAKGTSKVLYPKALFHLQELQTDTKTKGSSITTELHPHVLEDKEEGIAIGRSADCSEQKSAVISLFSECQPSSSQHNSGALQHNGSALQQSNTIRKVEAAARQSSNSNCRSGDHGLEKENQQKDSNAVYKIVPKKVQPVDETKKQTQQTLPKLSSHVASGDIMEPNLLSEEMVLCLSSIYLKLAKQQSSMDWETSSNISHSTLSSKWSFTSKNTTSWNQSRDVTEEIELVDPYRIISKSIRKNVGPYQYYQEVTSNLLDYGKIPRAAPFLKKLMNLLERLRNVDLRGLAHHQKLSFWINIYNVCMMHAFLEHGIPDSPHKVVSLMGKAVINVGGHCLSALAIEHFILRLPSDFSHVEMKNKERTVERLMWGTYGLDWPEPLVNFALCCGSWSSPALRVYTAHEIENELEVARDEYLQAAVGVTPSKIFIPKLLDWYMRDFAKDAQSLVEWISDQLPSGVGYSLPKCLNIRHTSETIEVMPYDFNFRYLFALQP
ncbi:hypothetical protein KP509_14G094300 [Ceratopteris richardii]|uniref:Uncharacterized protein n=1 Tax=Ceratopteris richardii TaxID=49495 RepID=A0A8T2TE87_CERRI|nr:hypothetical protein KP509_14G094300 [Ceratopteris richardii]